MSSRNFIENYKTSRDLVSFLKKKINILEYKDYKNRYDYIEGLSIEERILLITLMYIGRTAEKDALWYKLNFYNIYEYNYESWKNDKNITMNMLKKSLFINYLRDAISMYEKTEKLS